MYRRRYTPRYNNRTYARKRVYAPRRSYASAYIPSDNGGIRGAPMVKTSRGFRGDYSRSATEKKFVDLATASYAADTTGSVTALNLMDEGTSVSTRIGRKVCIKSVQVRGIISPTNDDSGNNLVRVMLVWDKQVNGVIATIANILSAATSNSFMNLDNRERFVVLMDKHYALAKVQETITASIGSHAGSPTVHHINKFKKLPRNSFTIYDGTGSGIADVNTGALYLVTIGNQTAGSGFGALVTVATRVRYTDS